MREYFHLLIYIEREFSPLARGGGGHQGKMASSPVGFLGGFFF